MAKSLRLNDRIRVSPIRVIDQDQKQLGVISASEALELARSAGLDLVEVSPTETPPVCRIMNYGKSQYEKKKRQKASAGSHVIVLKEVRFRPKTDANDRLIKMNRATRFLGEGHKVQFTMLFRGRERMHRDRAREMFEGILAEFGESVKIERRPLMDGRRMTMVVSPTKTGMKTLRQESEKATAKAAVEENVAASTNAPTGDSPTIEVAPVATESSATAAQPEAPAITVESAERVAVPEEAASSDSPPTSPQAS